MTKHEVSCIIKCSPGVIRRMWKSAQRTIQGGVGIRATNFKCLRCQTCWNCDDSDTNSHLTNVACSNCYSKNVVITSVEVEVWDKEDLEDLT